MIQDSRKNDEYKKETDCTKQIDGYGVGRVLTGLVDGKPEKVGRKDNVGYTCVRCRYKANSRKGNMHDGC